MTAQTIGITSARFPVCKRGLAVNIAASPVRHPSEPRVCVVDADPLTLDVTTRFAVRGPHLEDFAELTPPPVAALASVHDPALAVLPSSGASVGLIQRGTEQALPVLRDHFDIVICDLLGGPGGPPRVVGRLAQLDWLLVAVTPDVEPLAATARFLEDLDEACGRGEIAHSVRIGIVVTGDEGSADGDGSTNVAPEVIAKSLGRPVVGSIRQLWGRSVPNLGFGAALGIAELDDAVGALFTQLAPPTGLADVAFSRLA